MVTGAGVWLARLAKTYLHQARRRDCLRYGIGYASKITNSEHIAFCVLFGRAGSTAKDVSDGGRTHLLTRHVCFGVFCLLAVSYYPLASSWILIGRVVGYHDLTQRSWISTARWNSRFI